MTLNRSGSGARRPESSARLLAVTLLYVPADRPDRVAKALSLDADVVIVDLEDAVAPAAKDAARAGLPDLLGDATGPRVQVRTNAEATPWVAEDLAMVASLPAHVEVRLPKVESTDVLDRVSGLLGAERRLHCLLETALGVERAYDVASHPQVASVGLGDEDLKSELGVTAGGALDWARGRTIVAASAAGMPPPAQGVYTSVHDLDGLAVSCRSGRAFGFLGRSAIHPAQLPVIRAAYRPAEDEVARARLLLAALEDAEDRGSGVTVLPDGSFVDPAMVAGARRVLALEVATRPRS
jgi:citrate lyase subunit beta/citryl-CoA lyase